MKLSSYFAPTYCKVHTISLHLYHSVFITPCQPPFKQLNLRILKKLCTLKVLT
jgi:hypothetical protein